MNKKNVLICFLSYALCAATFSCSSPTEDIAFDSTTWKSDLNGCAGERLKLREQVEDMRLKLVGLNERQIRKLLGKPDTEELLERSQKIYIYYITAGPKCAQTGEVAVAASSVQALAVRMDALGAVREANVLVE